LGVSDDIRDRRAVPGKGRPLGGGAADSKKQTQKAKVH